MPLRMPSFGRRCRHFCKDRRYNRSGTFQLPGAKRTTGDLLQWRDFGDIDLNLLEPMSHVKEDSVAFEATVDLRGCKAKLITVSIERNGGLVRVVAPRKSNNSDAKACHDNHVEISFNVRGMIDTDTTLPTATLSPDGVLCIKAKKNRASQQVREVSVSEVVVADDFAAIPTPHAVPTARAEPVNDDDDKKRQHHTIALDLPGMVRFQDVRVQLEQGGRIMRVTVVRQSEGSPADAQRLERKIKLGHNFLFDASRVHANLSSGVLTVTFPRRKQSASKIVVPVHMAENGV